LRIAKHPNHKKARVHIVPRIHRADRREMARLAAKTYN
jgi:hypothetical protein